MRLQPSKVSRADESAGERTCSRRFLFSSQRLFDLLGGRELRSGLAALWLFRWLPWHPLQYLLQRFVYAEYPQDCEECDHPQRECNDVNEYYDIRVHFGQFPPFTKCTIQGCPLHRPQCQWDREKPCQWDFVAVWAWPLDLIRINSGCRAVSPGCWPLRGRWISVAVGCQPNLFINLPRTSSGQSATNRAFTPAERVTCCAPANSRLYALTT